ncbi:MAG: dipicolinate synthase subunit DpsA [Oscillospiraceae bacterium]|nr:dipicolinate synthase subunit DpsA [Oscillospiraceae bacterium]
MPTILVAGGDLRYVYTARALLAEYDVCAVGFTRIFLPDSNILLAETAADTLPLCDVLLLPMPVSDDGVQVNAPFSSKSIPLAGLLPKLRPDALVFGGKFGAARELFTNAGFPVIDYLDSEELAARNAIPTAEGAVQIMLEEMPRTIHGSRVLVTGFGRIGSRLAYILRGLGAEVTVAARHAADRTRAQMLGCEAVDYTQIRASQFDVLCNTVPAKVITAELLAAMQPDALVLDLASKPGGVDLDAAQQLGRRVIWALSLPGKTAPVTAGEIIAETVSHLIKEQGVTK